MKSLHTFILILAIIVIADTTNYMSNAHDDFPNYDFHRFSSFLKVSH